MNTQDIIIIIVLFVILISAVKSFASHMKGEGSCCGGPKERAIKKHISGKPKHILVIHIEGMHCENCKTRIENRLNELADVTAKVNLKKATALVSLYSDEVSEDTIRNTIEKLDYVVVSVENQ